MLRYPNNYLYDSESWGVIRPFSLCMLVKIWICFLILAFRWKHIGKFCSSFVICMDSVRPVINAFLSHQISTATSQSTIIFSHNKSALGTSHPPQPTEMIFTAYKSRAQSLVRQKNIQNVRYEERKKCPPFLSNKTSKQLVFFIAS